MYNRHYCTQGMITRVACVTSEDHDDNDTDDDDGNNRVEQIDDEMMLTMTISDVWEMKTSKMLQSNSMPI